jgi:uncharacterized protein (UPF0548 family)
MLPDSPSIFSILESVKQSDGEQPSAMVKLTWRKPSATTLRRFLEEQASADFNYQAVGATAGELPAGFVVDRTRILLGSGEAVYQSACRALERWQQFQLGWVEAWPADTPLKPGEQVAVTGWAVGFWWLNACRIVYVVKESGSNCRFGFAYGTLPCHVGSGEERFLIEWNRETDQVHYDILAFSRPNHWLIRLGYPLVRRNQKRFGRDSSASLFRAVQPASPLPAISQSTE